MLLLFHAGIFFLTSSSAQVSLQIDSAFSTNMVLQRNKPITVWGKGNPGTSVSVSFHGDKITGKIKTDSTWLLVLKSQPANGSPATLLVTAGIDSVTVQNILVGDVWLCIGQSNMEWPLINEQFFSEEKSERAPPNLRIYNPVYAGKNIYAKPYTDSVLASLNTTRFYQGCWEECDSNSRKNMSAVSYYFGKEIITRTGVPVGLINLSIGGAPLETFIDIRALQQNKQFATKVTGNWLKNNSIPVWVRDRGEQNVGALPNVISDEMGKNHAYKPGFAYASGIHPRINLPICGIICYQGESNAQEMARVEEYGRLTALMVQDYRNKWKNPSLPFYFVQLSSIDTTSYKSQLWPEFRNEQRKMLAYIPRTGMAVTSDIGALNDVHPTNKREVGKRLARWALLNEYKQKQIVSGPLPTVAKYTAGKVIIQFQYVGSSLKTNNNAPVAGFSVPDSKIKSAKIAGSKVILTVDHKTKPKLVYYSWQPYATGNLINSEGLPASTFKISIR